MKIQELWHELRPVHIDTPASDILDHFANAGGPPFLPVVDDDNCPVGVVREKELKPYLYSFFGRELLTRRQLTDFLYTCPIMPSTVATDDLLRMAAEKDDPDGVICVEALRAIENECLTYDVLILDQMMPNLTGIELAQQALEVHPRVPIIMCTGYTDSVSPEAAKEAGIKALFLKPMSLGQIAERAKHEIEHRRALGGARGWPCP